MRPYIPAIVCLTTMVLASSKPAQMSEGTALAHLVHVRPVTLSVSEPSITSDELAPVRENGIVTFRKLAIECVLETCGVMVCFVLMATNSMKFCDPPSPGSISGLLAVLVIIKLMKSIMTAFRTFPQGVSCDTRCSDLMFAPGLKGIVQKLGIGDMIWLGFIVAACITVIVVHYPFCAGGSPSLPDYVSFSFTGLLIANLIQFIGTIAHTCLWGRSQIEEFS